VHRLLEPYILTFLFAYPAAKKLSAIPQGWKRLAEMLQRAGNKCIVCKHLLPLHFPLRFWLLRSSLHRLLMPSPLTFSLQFWLLRSCLLSLKVGRGCRIKRLQNCFRKLVNAQVHLSISFPLCLLPLTYSCAFLSAENLSAVPQVCKDAAWLSGNHLHKSVSTVSHTWLPVEPSTWEKTLQVMLHARASRYLNEGFLPR
jgi:hypothetical protein